MGIPQPTHKESKVGLSNFLVPAALGGLIVGSSAEAPVELAPGTNDAFLTSQSGETSGLLWSTTLLFDNATATWKCVDSAADTDGDDLFWKGSDGGAHTSNNPDGGSLIFEPGIKGAGGAGSDGRLIVRQPGGTPGTDDLELSHGGTNAVIDALSGSIIFKTAGNTKLTISSNGNLTTTGDLVLADGQSLNLGSSSGTKIGTGASQKMGFYGVTPVVQTSHIIDADGNLSDITTKFNQLLADLATLGLQAAA